MNYKNIDINSWDRKSSFNLFSGIHDPVFSIGLRIDVPLEFVKNLKEKNIKPFNAILFSVSVGCNKIENFRYRLGKNNTVKLYDSIDPCWVEMGKDNQLNVRTCKFTEHFNTFVDNMKSSSSLEINSDFAHSPYIATSTQPWFDLTSLNNIKYSAEDSVAKLVWGKVSHDSFYLNIEVNHKFVDGYYISLLKKEIEATLKKL
jgi:chloramphenicol O-acetyltransferase type A